MFLYIVVTMHGNSIIEHYDLDYRRRKFESHVSLRAIFVFFFWGQVICRNMKDQSKFKRFDGITCLHFQCA